LPRFVDQGAHICYNYGFCATGVIEHKQMQGL